MAIGIKRSAPSAGEWRRLACRCKDVDQARRMLAIALVLDGASRADAAAAGMQRQTLRDWVVRYNGEGVEGLVDRPRSGRPPLLKAEQLAELDRIVETGSDVEVDGIVRWRCVDLKGLIAERFDVDISERSVGRVLNERGLRRLSARSRHPKTDEAAQEAFKKTSPRR